MKRWTVRRFRALLRQSGPSSLQFRRRLALLGGAVLVGLAALVFAKAANLAMAIFQHHVHAHPYLPFFVTPLGFIAIVWVMQNRAPLSAGSGIPQIIAALRAPPAFVERLLQIRIVVYKCVLTLAGLLVGASVGREGPTVQISTAVLAWVHKVLKVPMRSSIIIAGGAAGIAAAFNTPLAGIAFAIEELATAYEQRTTLLVITAVIISGMVALSLAGNYVYFGFVSAHLDVSSTIIATLASGVLGGLLGGLFSLVLLNWLRGKYRLARLANKRALLTAGVCGLIVATLGHFTGLTWGTGYGPARSAVTGMQNLPWYFMPAKFAATLVTGFTGLPGGLFAPSLATGAGVGGIVRMFMPGQPEGPIILLGMTAYFTGVVRAPLTAVIVISEATGGRGLMLPLLGSALIADSISSLICRERLYHGLSHAFSSGFESGEKQTKSEQSS